MLFLCKTGLDIRAYLNDGLWVWVVPSSAGGAISVHHSSGGPNCQRELIDDREAIKGY
jgi:hypothetical protein